MRRHMKSKPDRGDMGKGLSFALILGAAMVAGMAQAQTAATAPSTKKAADAASTSSEHQLPSPIPDTKAKLAKVWQWSRHRAQRAFFEGARAIEKDDLRAAEGYFLRAHRLDPNNERYPISAEIARQYLVTQLVQQAKREWALGRKDASLTAVEKA